MHTNKKEQTQRLSGRVSSSSSWSTTNGSKSAPADEQAADDESLGASEAIRSHTLFSKIVLIYILVPIPAWALADANMPLLLRTCGMVATLFGIVLAVLYRKYASVISSSCKSLSPF